MATVTESRAEINGLDFAYLEAGTGPLALCIHGFPDTAWGWRHLLVRLADAGFRAIAPFARGYAPTAVPGDGGSPLGAWVADACAFHEHFGGDEPGVIVGHDWGAMATYGAASFAPDRWRTAVTASVPPTSVMATRMLDYDQLKRFWYQYVFLQPSAEMIVSNGDLEFIARLWTDWSPGFDARTELGRVKDALREPRNLSAALHTYRSMYDMALQPPDLAAQGMAVMIPHTQPTLYLHGAQDTCVPVDVAAETAAVLPEGSRVEVIEGAGHFLQYEQPGEVNDLIVEFVTS